MVVTVVTMLGGVRTAVAEVVARVGGKEVTTEEVRSYLDTIDPGERAALARDPALASQVVRTYLARQAVLKEARAAQWDERPEVKAQLDRVRSQALVELYLQTVSRPAEGYPSDAEVQAAYDANRTAFEVPRQYRVAQIFVAAPRTAAQEDDERARRKVEAVRAKLAAKGADFAAVARAESEEKDSAQRGGEIGWLSEAQIVPRMRGTITALAKGAVSDPVRLDDGWHVLQLMEVKPASVRPLAEARDALVARLRADRAQANRQAYLARLMDQNPPVINELAVSSLAQKKP